MIRYAATDYALLPIATCLLSVRVHFSLSLRHDADAVSRVIFTRCHYIDEFDARLRYCRCLADDARVLLPRQRYPAMPCCRCYAQALF